jgi:hypothetical protein
MAPLIISATGEQSQKASSVLANIDRWFAARAIQWRVLPAESFLLPDALAAVNAVVFVGADARRLEDILGRLPVGAFGGIPFLWIGSFLPKATDATAARLWHALQNAGFEIQIKTAVIGEWHSPGHELSSRDIARIDDALIALGEGIIFCGRLQRKRESMDLAQYFAHAPLLA